MAETPKNDPSDDGPVFFAQVTKEQWEEQVKATPYLNENGLVEGRIPAGKPCPFLTECKFRMERCPAPESLKEGSFSCAAARLLSMIKRGEGTSLMREFVQTDPKD